MPVPEVPEPVELPPPERVPLVLPPVTTGGIVAGQGRKKIPPQPGLTLPALAVIGKAATRTIATARVPSTFFMTFSFFKTVFVSIRLFVSFPSCPEEIATAVPGLARSVRSRAAVGSRHAQNAGRIGEKSFQRRESMPDASAATRRRRSASLSIWRGRLSVRIGGAGVGARGSVSRGERIEGNPWGTYEEQAPDHRLAARTGGAASALADASGRVAAAEKRGPESRLCLQQPRLLRVVQGDGEHAGGCDSAASVHARRGLSERQRVPVQLLRRSNGHPERLETGGGEAFNASHAFALKRRQSADEFRRESLHGDQERFGRDAGIRTRDPLNPIQVRYQTAPHPDRKAHLNRVGGACQTPR